MALLGQLNANSSYDDVAEAIVKETIRRGYTSTQSIAVLSDAIQESGLKPGIVSPNGAWIGIYQQDGGYSNRNDPNANIQQFLDRLDVKLKSSGASPDIWKDIFWLQQRPGEPSADQAFANGRQAYLTEIQSRVAVATALYNKYSGGAVVSPGSAVVAAPKADFNEFPIWTDNNQDRGGTKIDLFLIHTQEGGGGNSAAADLANYFNQPGINVSYHYTVSQASDGGTTVVDCVDTDYACWAVGDANNRSINLCFAGSSVNDSRDKWMARSHAIDAAAYIAVQDCKKYGISLAVVGPPYTSGKPGISDHMYVTKILGWGDHVDCGPNFPWDYFAQRVAFWANGGKDGSTPPATTTPPVTTPPASADPLIQFKQWLDSASEIDLLRYIAAQLGPGDPAWASKGMTLRDKEWAQT